ncbi:MAG: hypothetical protein KKB13_18345, partial [Chloroflexi bacterium]|nr:hypothetical protein [Chloroflexota bacterium]
VLRAYQHRGTAGTLARLDQETAQIVAAQAWEHRTVAVWSPKGGTGKTFVAVNLACLFGVVCNLDTILLDVDMDTGDLFISLDGLGGDFGHTIHELATRWSKGEPLTTKLVESYLIPYQGRLKVLRGIFDSTEGGMAPLVEAEAIAFMGELLRIVRQMASMVVVDMGLSAAHPMHLGALDRADVVLIVLAPTHPSSFRAWSHMGALQREMEISPARFKLILNGYADNMEFDRQGTIQELGLPEFVVIPQDVENEVVRSINRGQPLVLYEPHREVSRQLAVLGAHFYPPLNTIWSQYGGRGLLPKRSLLRRRKH